VSTQLLLDCARTTAAGGTVRACVTMVIVRIRSRLQVQCVGSAPHPRPPLPSHGIAPAQNHPFEFKLGFRQALAPWECLELPSPSQCQLVVPRESHWRRGPGRIQPPNCHSMRRSLCAAPVEPPSPRESAERPELELELHRVTAALALALHSLTRSGPDSGRRVGASGGSLRVLGSEPGAHWHSVEVTSARGPECH
jgi:hypothetical protein